jgi:hypothetical protein
VTGRRTEAEREALIAELAAHAAELSAMLDESVSTLASLVAERPQRGAGAADGEGTGPVAPEILEIAMLQAQAPGMSVEELLREAGLPDAGAVGPDRDGGRSRRARDEARRLQAESQAVKAQTVQAQAQAALAKAKVAARRPRQKS